MSTTSSPLTEGQQLELSILYATIFMLTTSVECLEAVQATFTEQGARYITNKAKDAEKACNAVLKELTREKTKYMTAEEKKVSELAVETQKDLVYNFFMLDPEQQRRVSGLIAKLKSEKQ